MIHEILRFGLVGVFSVLIYVAVFAMSLNFFELEYTIAVIPAAFLSLLVCYGGQYYFSLRSGFVRQVSTIRYIVLSLSIVILNAMALNVAVEKFNLEPIMAQMLLVTPLAVFSSIVWKFILIAERNPEILGTNIRLMGAWPQPMLNLAFPLLLLATLLVFCYPILGPAPFNAFQDGSFEYLSVAKYYAGFYGTEPPVSALAVSVTNWLPWNQYLVLIGSIYKAVGREVVWLPQAIGIFFWFLAAFALFSWLRDRFGFMPAALASLSFSLHPSAVKYVTAVAPEPIFLAFQLGSLYLLNRYRECPTWPRFFIFLCMALWSICFSPKTLFLLAIAFLFVEYERLNLMSLMRDIRIIFFVLGVGLITYFYFSPNWISGHGNDFLLFFLFKDSYFWENLAVISKDYLHLDTIVIVCVALVFGGRSADRGMLAALVIGYLAFGTYFTNHISSHEYYHIQWFVIAAFSWAMILNRVWVSLKTRNVTDRVYLMIGMYALLIAVSFYRIAMSEFAMFHGEKFQMRIKAAEQQEANTKKLYEIVGDQPSIYLSGSGGARLQYFGLRGWGWPHVSNYEGEFRAKKTLLTEDQHFYQTWLNINSGPIRPKYFVIDDVGQFQRQAYTYKLLTENYEVVYDGPAGLVYDISSRE